jgi:hypothetical protein
VIEEHLTGWPYVVQNQKYKPFYSEQTTGPSTHADTRASNRGENILFYNHCLLIENLINIRKLHHVNDYSCSFFLFIYDEVDSLKFKIARHKYLMYQKTTPWSSIAIFNGKSSSDWSCDPLPHRISLVGELDSWGRGTAEEGGGGAWGRAGGGTRVCGLSGGFVTPGF